MEVPLMGGYVERLSSFGGNFFGSQNQGNPGLKMATIIQSFSIS